jgi:hypothetical protein
MGARLWQECRIGWPNFGGAKEMGDDHLSGSIGIKALTDDGVGYMS